MHNAALRRARPRLALREAAGARRSCSRRRCARCPASGYRGANVTIPHKLAALALADARDRRRRGDRRGQHAHLRRTAGSRPTTPTPAACSTRSASRVAGARALVLGAGGAARAAAWALREAGAAEVRVWNRTAERAARARARARGGRARAPGRGRPARQRDLRRPRPGDVDGRGARGARGSTGSSRPRPWSTSSTARRRRDARVARGRARAGATRRRRPRGAGPPGRPQLRALDRPERAARGDAAARARPTERLPAAAGNTRRSLNMRPGCRYGALMAVPRPVLLALLGLALCSRPRSSPRAARTSDPASAPPDRHAGPAPGDEPGAGSAPTAERRAAADPSRRGRPPGEEAATTSRQHARARPVAGRSDASRSSSSSSPSPVPLTTPRTRRSPPEDAAPVARRMKGVRSSPPASSELAGYRPSSAGARRLAGARGRRSSAPGRQGPAARGLRRRAAACARRRGRAR